MTITLATPHSIASTQTITDYAITNISVILNTSATINVSLFDVSGNLLSNRSFVMSGETYDSWGSSDAYIQNWIETQINELTTI